MYLSRVEIDLNNRKKTRELTHAGAFHNWVEQCFPQEIQAQTKTRKLWRIDQLRGKQYLLLVSETKPDLQRFERYGVEQTAETKSYDSFLQNLQSDMRMQFRVTLNPVVSISRPGKRGRVVPHVTAERQKKFLMALAEKNGFLLQEDECRIVKRGYTLLKKSGEKPLRLVRATYEGVLTIKDVDVFRKILTHGLGKKKAYGFGLLTVVPVRDIP